jgi:fibro-slime domain-containing protein
LHPAFSCYQSNPGAAASEGCQTGAQGTDSKIAIKAATDCSGIIQGIVETTLGSDKKPVLTEAGEKCFIEDKFFNQLFNYTEGVNEAVAWEMPFPKNDNGIWMFNSDSTIDGTKIGGFFPIENTTDDDILTVGGKKLGPLADARTKRDGESPYFINDSVDFYHYCKGPGWTDGVEDCGGSFMSLSDHQEFYNMLYGNTHWRENRNHHFCMEIHGTFTYSDTLEAGFSASGDQWVFIGKKLAVDNGGTHVNAPGFVQMKALNKTYSSFMKEGEKYPIDVFFCARRTSLSDFSMWTNFPITQE